MKMKRHLLYDELRSLSQLTNSWKEITMNFITDLSPSKWKEVVYDLILMIVDHYMKMTRYLSMKKTLTVIELTELFFEKIALRYEILNDIIINKDNLFISAFWSEICYHVKIKQRLSIVFYQSYRRRRAVCSYCSLYVLRTNKISLVRKQMIRQNDRIKCWNIIYEYIVQKSKMTELRFYL